MGAVLLVCGGLAVAGVLVLLVGVVIVGVRRPRYDIDAATAAHKERKAAGESPDILEPEPEEAVS